MNIKKITIISCFVIFLLSSLSHFVYDWFSNFFTSIFFPVNESIWEHTKMIFTTMVVWGIIEYFIISNHGKKNFSSALLISTIVTIIFLIVTFTPIYYIMDKKENMVITLIIYFISIVVGQIVSYFILKKEKKFKVPNTISLICIPIIFIIYGLLTYYPIKTGLFYDYTKSQYGIISNKNQK